MGGGVQYRLAGLPEAQQAVVKLPELVGCLSHLEHLIGDLLFNPFASQATEAVVVGYLGEAFGLGAADPVWVGEDQIEELGGRVVVRHLREVAHHGVDGVFDEVFGFIGRFLFELLA